MKKTIENESYDYNQTGNKKKKKLNVTNISSYKCFKISNLQQINKILTNYRWIYCGQVL